MSEPADYAAIRTRIIDWLDDKYHFGDAASLITSDDLSWLQNGVLDSLGFVQLILFLEATFTIELDRKDLTRENFDGMRKVIHYVTSHRQYRGVSA
jgi:acyl carrier protein